jgi:hypothetical protein
MGMGRCDQGRERYYEGKGRCDQWKMRWRKRAIKGRCDQGKDVTTRKGKELQGGMTRKAIGEGTIERRSDREGPMGKGKER